jgi:hypothetical protein
MRMPGKISKLSDEFGHYRLSILCLQCGHERVCEPSAIAPKVGWDCSLATLTQRLKCSQCGAKVARITALAAAHQRRPKWH